MISSEFLEKLEEVMAQINEPYEKVERLKYDSVDVINETYVSKILLLNVEDRERILEIIKKSLSSNKSHGLIRKWSRAVKGLGILLKEDSSENIDPRLAADVVVRISRWSYSDRFYAAFVPFAKKIVEIIWGRIDNLHKMYSRI